MLIVSDSTPRPWEELEQLVTVGEATELEAYLEELPVSEVARALAHLSGDQRELVLTVLGPAYAAEVIDEIPDAQAVDMVERLLPHRAANHCRTGRRDRGGASERRAGGLDRRHQ